MVTVLWEKPFITQHNAYTCKLIMQGEKDISISIKNSSSKKLLKRVPFIITTNKELHHYCSQEISAFSARCFKFYTKTPLFLDAFCKAFTHHCSLIDSTHRTVHPIPSTSGPVHIKDTPCPSDTDNYNNIHKIDIKHVYSHVLFIFKNTNTR